MKKEVGIAIRSKQTSNQLEPVTSNTFGPSCIGYYNNSKPNACTNKAFSSTSMRFNPYFGWYKIICKTHVPAKVGIESCSFARKCFICTCIWLWVITVANTGYISWDWFELVTCCLLTFYCDPYFPFQILIFIYILFLLFIK